MTKMSLPLSFILVVSQSLCHSISQRAAFHHPIEPLVTTERRKRRDGTLRWNPILSSSSDIAEPTFVQSTNALRSIRSCCHAAVASSLVEGATAVLWRDSSAVSTAPSSSHYYQTIFGVLRLIWKLDLARGLYRVSWLYQKHMIEKDNTSHKEGKVTTSESLDVRRQDASIKILAIMGNVWRTSAWIIGLGSIVDVAVAFQRNQPWRMAMACATTMLAWRWWSFRTTRHLQVQDDPVRKSALRAVQFMSVCIGTLWIRFLVSIALIVPQAPLIKRLLMLTNVQTPWITACLLINLRQAFLSNIASSVSGSPDEAKFQNTGSMITISTRLLRAQVKFYNQVASIFKGEISAKVLLVSGSLIRSLWH